LGKIYFREAPGQPWNLVGDAFEFSKWYVANCRDTKLGTVAAIIDKAQQAQFYWSNGIAFDGQTLAVSASTSRDNDKYLAAGLLLGPNGIHVGPYGYNSVWTKQPGEFWFMGPQIHPLRVAEN
jgi:hypothetical protein